MCIVSQYLQARLHAFFALYKSTVKKVYCNPVGYLKHDFVTTGSWSKISLDLHDYFSGSLLTFQIKESDS